MTDADAVAVRLLVCSRVLDALAVVPVGTSGLSPDDGAPTTSSVCGQSIRPSIRLVRPIWCLPPDRPVTEKIVASTPLAVADEAVDGLV